MKPENLESLRQIVRITLELPDDAEVDSLRQVAMRRWDSLAIATMVAAVESQFGVRIAPDEMSDFTSFSSISLILDEKGL